MLTSTCFTGRCKGFRLIEAETEEQLKNLVALWWPTENWKLEAYLENHPEDAAAFRRIMAKADGTLGPKYLLEDLTDLLEDLTDEELSELKAILERVPDPDSAIL